MNRAHAPGGVAAIIPAAGRGKRLQSKIPKAFVPVHGKPLIVHTLKNLLSAYPFTETVVLVDKPQTQRAKKILRSHGLKNVRVEAGGATRADSVRRGLLALAQAPEWVLIHDAARPLIRKNVVLRVLSGARKTGAALCVLPVTATVKRLDGSRRAVVATEDRGSLCLAQTPQVFRRTLLLSRYERLGRRALNATDEAALFDKSAVSVRVVEGDAGNLKVTTPEDLRLLEYYLRSF
jgi:2-C-methyl-D-erythritol 4-phosphate cytidylyltransferase